MPAKYFFIRLLRGTRHVTANTVTHWVTWLSSTGGVVIIAYIIASAIPNFGPLVSLIGALLGTFMCFQPMGAMWFYDNWHGDRTKRSFWPMVVWSSFVIVSGTFFMIGGTYGAVIAIINSGEGNSAWSCADNSNST